MAKNIIIDGKTFPVQPSQINVDPAKGFSHLWNAFGNSETECSAYWVVRLCQKLGGWVPFTIEQIEEEYQKSGREGFRFNRLVDPQEVFANPAEEFGKMAQHAALTRGSHPMAASLSYALSQGNNPPITVAKGGGWIVKGTDGKYYVTDDFVARCFKSSPAQDEAVVAKN